MNLYHVTIEFAKGLTDDKLNELLEKEFDEIEILERNGHKIKFAFNLHEHDGPGELENWLYYVLEDGNLGLFTHYEKVK